MNENKIAFLTYVRNGEAYLAKTIESVLAQTYTNLIYYLVDNQSTDKTFEIMMKYAQKDSRIRLMKGNNTMNVLTDCIEDMKECEYFALLDGDDWYAPEFAEEMIIFIEKKNLDFACCITEFKNIVTGAAYYRGHSQEAILEASEFREKLPENFSILRTTWGKVFKLSLLQNLDLSDFHKFSGKTFLEVDTIYVISALREAKRIGFLPKVLHSYFIMPSSTSRRYDTQSLDATVCLYNTLESFLNQNGKISRENIIFLYSFYLSEISEIKKNLFSSSMTMEEKLAEMKLISEHPITKQSIKYLK